MRKQKNLKQHISIFKKKGKCLFIESDSGYWWISHEKKPEKDILQGDEEFKKLKSLTVPRSVYESRYLLTLLTLTNDCNLRCRYCYVPGGQIKKRILEPSLANKFIDAILRLPKRHITFEFFGGEPLLYWERIKKHVNYILKKVPTDKKIMFSIVTNGTLLDEEKVKFLKYHKFRITVSLDGPREIHNRNRIFSNQKGTYEQVWEGIHLLQAGGINPAVVAVITEPDELSDVFDFLLDIGIHTMKLNPLQPFRTREETSVKEDHLSFQSAFAAAHLKVVDKIVKINKHSKNKILENNIAFMVLNLLFRTRDYMCLRSPCGAGIETVMVDENGNIYPCEGFHGQKEFVLGNIAALKSNRALECLLVNSSINQQVTGRTVDTLAECLRCPWKRFCGDCPARSYDKYLSFDRKGAYCEYQKKMFEGLLWYFSDNLDSVQYLISRHLLIPK